MYRKIFADDVVSIRIRLCGISFNENDDTSLLDGMNNNNSSSNNGGDGGSRNSNAKLTFSVYFILFYFCSLHLFTYATVSEAPYLSHDNAQNYTKIHVLMTTRL